MKKTQLAKSIAMLAAGVSLSFGAVSSVSAHTMYNTYNAGTAPTAGGTDGWTHVGGSSGSGALTNWVGTTGGALPFSYTGSSALNWAAELHNAGDSLEISRKDAFNTYGVAADIDTAKGGWLDAETPAQGWAHNTDIGLFKSHVDAYVTLNLTSINYLAPYNTTSTITNFGVTVFTGMDSGTGYSHHGQWNSPDDGIPFTNSNPFGTTGVNYVDGLGVGNGGASYSSNVNGTTGFTFLAHADQIYSIYLGGSGGLFWNDTKSAYALNITSAPVPVPGAVWLFGSALMGLLGFNRKKAAISA